MKMTQNKITGESKAMPAESGKFSNIKSIKKGYKLTRGSAMTPAPPIKGKK